MPTTYHVHCLCDGFVVPVREACLLGAATCICKRCPVMLFMLGFVWLLGQCCSGVGSVGSGIQSSGF